MYGLEKSVPATSWAVFLAKELDPSASKVSGEPPCKRYEVNSAPVYVTVVVGLAAANSQITFS